MPDIDIDFADRSKPLELFKHVVASRLDGELKPHNTGIYVTEIPYTPHNNLSTIDYKVAEERGYFKIDFLNVSLYKGVRDEEHLIQLMEQEPIWDLLEESNFTDLLFHLNGYTNLLKQMKPRSIEELAMFLGLIRPGKKNLIGKTWTEIGGEIWTKPTNGEYYFKKSHAVAYATAIVVQMNLLCEQIAAGELSV